MAGSTNKKVCVVRFDRESVVGIVNPQGYLSAAGIEVMSVSGSIALIGYEDAKAICFLRDLEDSTVWQPNRAFTTRPKTAGLWVRVAFRDGDSLEGMIANDLSLIEPQGITVVPPDAGASSQKIFVPRQAVRLIQVLGVIGSPLRRRPAKAREKPEGQMGMFE